MYILNIQNLPEYQKLSYSQKVKLSSLCDSNKSFNLKNKKINLLNNPTLSVFVLTTFNKVVGQ